MKTGLAVLIAAACLAATPAANEWLREVEVRVEPGKPGEAQYQVRMMPDRTLSYEYLSFECIYHQEFPWTDTRGNKTTKILEPVSFFYRENNVSLTTDLDHHTAFRVPVGLSVLQEKFGDRTFNKDYPIVINIIRISGVATNTTLWTYDVPATGRHVVADLVAADRAAKEKAASQKEDISDIFLKPKPPPPKPKVK